MKPGDIKVEISGGLANQIFMFLGGKWMANQKSKELSLMYFPNSTHTESLLDFKLADKVLRYTRLYGFMLKVIRKLSKSSKNFEKLLLNFGYVFVRDIGYPNEKYLTKNVRYFSGYCQSYLIYEEVLHGKSVFEFLKYEPSSWTSYYVKNIIQNNDIAIHVRLGDYIKEIDSIGLVGLNYFERSIKTAIENGGTGKIRVFTNDLEECKNFLDQLPYIFDYVKTPKEVPDIDSLYIISRHEYLVLSNSSFSLLAGLESKAKMVTRPNPWYKNIEEPEKLSPETWISIPSSWR